MPCAQVTSPSTPLTRAYAWFRAALRLLWKGLTDSPLRAGSDYARKGKCGPSWHHSLCLVPSGQLGASIPQFVVARWLPHENSYSHLLWLLGEVYANQ